MNNLLGSIDELLGRITMYRLVVYSLVAMIVMAFALIFTGSLSFSPIWLGASVIVCVAASYASNRLFGWLFGVKPHSESAIITGLILALLILPPLGILDLVKIAIVAMIAMASKYILVIRNRHIFNPAAIAVVIAGFAGLADAGWWIATPEMLPITIVVALLILHRTHKLLVGVIYVGVALVSLLIQGTSPAIALTSWPLVFLAGVMLSEPLTLPARAYQQYILASAVGLLTTLSMHYGAVSMTPALALVIGNIYGWWYGQRKDIRLRFVGKRQISSTNYDFVFDTPKMHFEPGQYAEFTLIHEGSDSRGHRRIFSIASRPGEEQINIGMKIPEKPSSFKRSMMALQPGAVIHAARIAGDFVLPKDANKPIVFIAGGIGVTPFISFCQNTDRPMRLIYAVYDVVELSYVDTLRQHNVDVTVVAAQQGTLPDPDWHLEIGRLDSPMLEKLIPKEPQPAVYVSGPPAMVLGVRATIKKLGIKDVKVDEFSGY